MSVATFARLRDMTQHMAEALSEAKFDELEALIEQREQLLAELAQAVGGRPLTPEERAVLEEGWNLQQELARSTALLRDTLQKELIAKRQSKHGILAYMRHTRT